MANELLHINRFTGRDLAAVISNAAGQYWNGSAFETLAVANFHNYAITMTESPTASYRYLASMPAGITAAGLYGVKVYNRNSGTLTVSCELVAEGSIYWNGTAEVLPATATALAVVAGDAANAYTWAYAAYDWASQAKIAADKAAVASLISDGRKTYYVSKDGNDTTGDGSKIAPWLTIGKVLTASGSQKGIVIDISEGTYTEVLDMSARSGIELRGHGWDTIISGNTDRFIKLGNNSTLRHLKICANPDYQNGWRSVSGIGVDNISLDGVYIQASCVGDDITKGAEGLTLTSCPSTKITNCKIEGSWRGINAEICNSMVIENTSIKAQYESHIVGVAITSASHVILRNVQVCINHDLSSTSPLITAIQIDNNYFGYAIFENVNIRMTGEEGQTLWGLRLSGITNATIKGMAIKLTGGQYNRNIALTHTNMSISDFCPDPTGEITKGSGTIIYYPADDAKATLAKPGDAMTLTSAYDAAKTAAPETGGSIAAIKTKTDALPASPAATGAAMTLTSAYDAAKTAAPETGGNIAAINDKLPSDTFARLAHLDADVSAAGGGASVEDIDEQLSMVHGAGLWSGTDSGTGDIAIDHNYGGADALRYMHNGAGVDGGVIRCFLVSEWADGLRVCRGLAYTDTAGRWVEPIYVNPGDYHLDFSKPDQFATTRVTVTVEAES